MFNYMPKLNCTSKDHDIPTPTYPYIAAKSYPKACPDASIYLKLIRRTFVSNMTHNKCQTSLLAYTIVDKDPRNAVYDQD